MAEQPKHEGHALRVVANCKLKNRHCNLLLNNCLERPLSALVPLIAVLPWWRTKPHMLMVNLHRAYQALQTGPMERLTHLFLWRWSPEASWLHKGHLWRPARRGSPGGDQGKGCRPGESHPPLHDVAAEGQGLRQRRGPGSLIQRGSLEDEREEE